MYVFRWELEDSAVWKSSLEERKVCVHHSFCESGVVEPHDIYASDKHGVKMCRRNWYIPLLVTPPLENRRPWHENDIIVSRDCTLPYVGDGIDRLDGGAGVGCSGGVWPA